MLWVYVKTFYSLLYSPVISIFTSFCIEMVSLNITWFSQDLQRSTANLECRIRALELSISTSVHSPTLSTTSPLAGGRDGEEKEKRNSVGIACKGQQKVATLASTVQVSTFHVFGLIFISQGCFELYSKLLNQLREPN